MWINIVVYIKLTTLFTLITLLRGSEKTENILFESKYYRIDEFEIETQSEICLKDGNWRRWSPSRTVQQLAVDKVSKKCRGIVIVTRSDEESTEMSKCATLVSNFMGVAQNFRASDQKSI